LPDFSKVSYGTLRRYQSFYNIRLDNNITSRNHSELVKIVNSHFASMEYNPESVLEKFLKIDKDQVQDLNSNIRKSMRYQEKLEKKQINKILDNYNKNNQSSI